MYFKLTSTLMLMTGITLTASFLIISLVFAQDSGTLARITTASNSSRDSLVGDISADGARIAFSSDSDFFSQGIPAGQYEIWLYNTQTRSLNRITTASDVGRWSSGPSLNFDGTKIAFESRSDFLNQGISTALTEIWLYDTTKLKFTRVTTGSNDTRISISPSLSAGGEKIAFLSESDFLNEGLSERFEIWLYDMISDSFTRITTNLKNHPNVSASVPYLSPDGTKVFFETDTDFLGQGIPDGQFEIWMYDTMITMLNRLTTASSSDRSSHKPRTNTDGTKVVFYSDSDFLAQGIPNDQNEIWLYDMTTLSFTRITTASDSSRDSFSLHISPDGTIITFGSDADFLSEGISDNAYNIWLYDLTSKSFTRVTTNSDSSRSSFNPRLNYDGTKIAFTSDTDFLGQNILDNQFEVWLYNAPFDFIIPDSGGTAKPAAGVMISAGTNAFTDAIMINYDPQPITNTGTLSNAGFFYTLDATYLTSGQPAQLQSGERYTITVTYQQINVLPGVLESDLSLYFWNGNLNQWITETTSIVDSGANTITANPDHFSLWAVLGRARSLLNKVYLPVILK